MGYKGQNYTGGKGLEAVQMLQLVFLDWIERKKPWYGKLLALGLLDDLIVLPPISSMGRLLQYRLPIARFVSANPVLIHTPKQYLIRTS